MMYEVLWMEADGTCLVGSPFLAFLTIHVLEPLVLKWCVALVQIKLCIFILQIQYLNGDQKYFIGISFTDILRLQLRFVIGTLGFSVTSPYHCIKKQFCHLNGKVLAKTIKQPLV